MWILPEDDAEPEKFTAVTVTASSEGWASGQYSFIIEDKEKGWRAAKQIDKDVCQMSTRYMPCFPSAAMDAVGNVRACWYVDNVGKCQNVLAANTYDATNRMWGISTAFAAVSYCNPRVVMAGNGQYLATWTVDNVVYAEGNQENCSGVISMPVTTDRRAISLSGSAIDSAGNCVAIGRQFTSSVSESWMNRYDVTLKGWTGPQVFYTTTASIYDALASAVAADTSGNVILAQCESYQSPITKTTEYNVFAFRYDAGSGTWHAPVPLELASTLYCQCQAAMSQTGDALVIWTRGTWLYAVHYDGTAGTWSTPEKIQSEATTEERYRWLVMDDEGNAMAAWTQGTTVWMDRFDKATGAWQGAYAATWAQGTFAGLAGCPGGDVMAAWTASDRTNVWSRIYDASTSTWGPQELVPTIRRWSIPGESRIFGTNQVDRYGAVWIEYTNYRSNALRPVGLWANMHE